MNGLQHIPLSPNQRQALDELHKTLIGAWGIEKITLYGSVARGDATPESDIDLLVITREPLKRSDRHRITDAVFAINLKYDTTFSTLVVDRGSWEEGCFSILPIHEEILREGIVL